MGKDSTASAPKKDAAPAPQAGAQDHAKKFVEPATPKGKGHTPLPGGCHAVSCKAAAHRFNFCDEHYDHFKFGLIKKTGERVSDYEKKIEHYMAHQQRSAAPLRKVA